MTAISRSAYSNFNFNPLRGAPPAEPIVVRTYLGQGLSCTTNLINLLYAPCDFVFSARDQIEAEKVGDVEGSYENWLRIIAAPLNATASMSYNAPNIQAFLTYIGSNASTWSGFGLIAKRAPFVGVAACTIESIYEMMGVREGVSMLKLLGSKPIETRTDRELFQTLQRIHTQYGKQNRNVLRMDERSCENMTQSAKDRALIRRVHHRCSDRIHEMVPALIREYNFTVPQERENWRQQSIELLQDIKIQSQKKTALHLTGLLANVITLVALIAILCACPYTFPLVLLIVGGVFYIARYGISEGMMHTRGWHFDGANLIPQCVKALYRALFVRSVLPHDEHTQIHHHLSFRRHAVLYTNDRVETQRVL